jgi:hypothetical protein
MEVMLHGDAVFSGAPHRRVRHPLGVLLWPLLAWLRRRCMMCANQLKKKILVGIIDLSLCKGP